MACQARNLANIMVDPGVDLTCIFKYMEGDNYVVNYDQTDISWVSCQLGLPQCFFK